jgi:two-component system OmpR family sensor kinase
VPLNLPDLAAGVVADMAQAALDREIDLGMDADSVPAARIRGDADALRILLTNLIDNALAYIPRGSRVDVQVRGRAGSREVELVVRDNGPGIPAAERGRVFDRFYRLPDAPTGGSGLGLAIVAEIAQSHGARLALEDATPGLRVRVTFPAA